MKNPRRLIGREPAFQSVPEGGLLAQYFLCPCHLLLLTRRVEAEIVNNWNEDITAVLKEIKSDSSAGAKGKSLVFSVTGDVQAGDSLDLSIPLGSGNYDAIVPKSAVHTGDKGSYVYTVRSKNTPLGNRYYAEKVEVNVEADRKSVV